MKAGILTKIGDKVAAGITSDADCIEVSKKFGAVAGAVYCIFSGKVLKVDTTEVEKKRLEAEERMKAAAAREKSGPHRLYTRKSFLSRD